LCGKKVVEESEKFSEEELLREMRNKGWKRIFEGGFWGNSLIKDEGGCTQERIEVNIEIHINKNT
jgi:hypothetical protein